MDGKPSLMATWGILLLSFATFINCQDDGCTWLPNTKGAPTCSPGEDMIYEMRYSNGMNTAWCCKAGAPGAPALRAQSLACRTTACLAPGKSDPCSTDLDTWVINGTVNVYDELSRDSCITESGSPGEATYCCRKGSMESSLASMVGVERNEFPHMVRLDIHGAQCGATIYNKRYILTAAHCVVDQHTHELKPKEPKWNVFVGRNLRDTPGPENDYTIVNAIFHPEYSSLKGHPELEKTKLKDRQQYNDIALLQVDRDIKFGPNVKALPIAPKGFNEIKNADTAMTLGWGMTDTGTVSDILQKSNLLIRRDEGCFGEGGPWPLQRNNTERILCLGGVLDGTFGGSTGKGDSGGPAICQDNDGFAVLCGLVSAGGNFTYCIQAEIGEKCKPNMFTEVDFFVDWITEKAGEQDPSTFFKAQLYGEMVKGNEAEHQVRITSDSGKPCGGTLIAPDTVVTAAHCIADGNGKPLSGVKVWSGVKDISGSQGNSQAVKSIATLDGFKMIGNEVNVEAQGNFVRNTDNNYANDLGIIKLQDPVQISPAKLPSLPKAAGAPGSAFEFTFPRNTSWGGELRKREFVVLDKKDCQKRWDHVEFSNMNRKLGDNVLCGVEKYSGGSKCDRELGGGLICKGADGRDELCGVQSHRFCQWSIPNDFVDVGAVAPWIQAKM